MAERSTRTAVLITIPLTIILIWCFCWFLYPWCFFCRICPDCEKCVTCPSPAGTAATIVVEDIHSATWMVSDNGWIGELGTTAICQDTAGDAFGDCQSSYEPYGENQNFRPSVLFQIGHLLDDEVPANHFELVRISFTDGSTPIELAMGQFDWLDVNAAGKDCPIDAFHAYSMFHNDLVGTGCDDALCTVGGSEAPATCLRDRALHASLAPDIGLITYWPGVNLYSMDTATTTTSDHGHLGYVFNAVDEITVDHWLDGCFQDRHTDVSEIRVVYKSDSSTHTMFHDPPMNGAELKVLGP